MKVWIEKVKGDEYGKILLSPRRNKDRADIYKNMRETSRGDVVIHYLRGEFIAASVIKSDYYEEVEHDEEIYYCLRLEKCTKFKEAISKAELTNRVPAGAYLTECPQALFDELNFAYINKTESKLPHYDAVSFPEVIAEPRAQYGVVSYDISLPAERYRNVFVSVKTKPFVILAGISGTGKSRLVKELAYLFCPKELREDKYKPGNYELIKVKPNWHDSTEVLGYVTRITGKPVYMHTAFVRFAVKALCYPKTPFFLCLDEMNLAPVEQYLAEYLSVLETRTGDKGTITSDYLIQPQLFREFDKDKDFWKILPENANVSELKKRLKAEGLRLPQNLIIMGTVNIDETTHTFSRKVLDRAMTIEMNDFDLSENLTTGGTLSYPLKPLNGKLVIPDIASPKEALGFYTEEIIEFLKNINRVLDKSPFKAAYRVRDEFLIYCRHYFQLPEPGSLNQALDELTKMKILPKIEGDESRTGAVLEGLAEILTEDSFPKSFTKIKEMLERLMLYHYTSYWD